MISIQLNIFTKGPSPLWKRSSDTTTRITNEIYTELETYPGAMCNSISALGYKIPSDLPPSKFLNKVVTVDYDTEQYLNVVNCLFLALSHH